MDLQEMQNKINNLLNGEGRKLVFWYDEDAEYIDEIDSIQLDGNSKLWKVTENNWFETKLQIEERDTETNYLLYAPFPRPDDRVNHLADMFYYSEHFYSDKLTEEGFLLETRDAYPVLHSTYNGLHYAEVITKNKLQKLKKYLEN
jgi:hypothetical protein